MTPDHTVFVTAAYVVAALILAVLIAQSYLQWRRVRDDYKKLFGGGDA